jgi:hypothetical protein
MTAISPELKVIFCEALDWIVMKSLEAATQDSRQARLERDFLQKRMRFYEKLIQPDSAEPATRFQTGKAYGRVGVLQCGCLDKGIQWLERDGPPGPGRPIKIRPID